MSASATIADPLLRRAFGRLARPSDPHRTARVRIGCSRLRAPVSRRGSAISRRTVMNNAGRDGRRSYFLPSVFVTNPAVRNSPTACLSFGTACTPMSFTNHRDQSFAGAFPRPCQSRWRSSWLNTPVERQGDGLKNDSCSRGNRSCR